MDIRLHKLSLKNFKSIRQLDVPLNGQNAFIYGANEAGKTTLYDAFLWALFGKDSLNQTNFDVKTLIDGQPVHNQEHGVLLALSVDKKRLQLRKSYAEKYTKKRGKGAQPEFTGHETSYYIDGVPSKLKDYAAAVSELCDEKLFRMLTSPRYCNEELHWQERRRLLLEICGDVSDDEVIRSSEELKDLPEILSGHSLENYRKIVGSRRAEINKELDRLPVRIDENKAAIAEAEAIDAKEARDRLFVFKNRLSGKQHELSRIENGGEIAERTKELREIEAELQRIRNQNNAAHIAKVSEKRAQVEAVESKLRKAKSEARSLELFISQSRKAVKAIEIEIQLLRSRWFEVNGQEWTEGACPTCGQNYPPEMVEQFKAKFNESKAKKLEKINEEGKELSQSLKRYESEIEKSEVALKVETGAIQECERMASELNKELDSLINEAEPVTDELHRLHEKTVSLKSSISELQQGGNEATAEVKAEIDRLNSDIQEAQTQLARVEASEKAQARIRELSEQEKALAQEYERLEHALWLTDQFVRTKVELLEEKINTRFGLVRFKLFSEQINGGLAECCDVTVNGVPYASLNNAARIQAGCDVIRTLQEHYGIQAPLWLDNRESVTEIPEMGCQVISLVVSPEDKELRIETNEAAQAA